MVAAQFEEFGARDLEATLVAIDRGDPGASPRETQGDRAADAAASARHHADTALQAEPIGIVLPGHVSLLPPGFSASIAESRPGAIGASRGGDGASDHLAE